MVTALLIEDNPGDARLIREALQDGAPEAFALEHASRLTTGLARLDAGGVNVVLLDLSLPDSHGLETFHQVRARAPRVPLIVLTALDDEAIAVETLHAGGQDYLSKSHLSPCVIKRSIRYAIERQRVSEELARAKEAAEAASRAKDRFLAVLSHELRTPLTPVLLSVSALESKLPAALHEELAVLRRNIELEARLIDDLLDLTRVGQGKIELHPEIVDAHDLLRTALQTCQPALQARSLDVTCLLRARQSQVRADPVRMQQVFRNLIDNAAKFTPRGGQIALGSEDDESGQLVITVQDTGIGIEPDLLPRIFDPFTQGERRSGGLGLGLTIARMMMGAQGGSLEAASAGPGQGSTFTVRLDRAANQVPTPAPPPPPAPVRARSRRILLVEDHADTRMTLTRLLQMQGHELRSAGTLQEALALARQETFDLLISDIELPDGSGLDLMRTLRIKGIAFSGFGTEADIRRSRAAGFIVHLTKPIGFRTLEEAIVGCS